MVLVVEGQQPATDSDEKGVHADRHAPLFHLFSTKKIPETDPSIR
jgi:hypothetical protein